MNNMKKSIKVSNGITLIALVITIIVLLILAGISISMLSGDNSILQKATDAKEQTGIGQEKEIVALAYNSALTKKVSNGDTTPVNDSELRNELSSYSEIDSVEKNNDDILVTFKSNRSYLIKSNGEISKQNNITISDLVVKNGSTEVVDGSKSVALNTPLNINFTASIEEETIQSISPTLPYTTNGTETSKTFTITGSNGTTKEYTVNLKGYYNIPDLKVGDFVNYILKAPSETELNKLNNDIATYSGITGNTTKTAESTLLCRVLEVDINGNPTKLISANGVNNLELYGADGYNNAVYLIKEMCEILYSGNQGTTSSLTIEDLEQRYFDLDSLTTSKGSTYGQTHYYENNAEYPNIATQEVGLGIGTILTSDGKNTIKSEGLGLSQQTTTFTGSGDASTLSDTNKGITVLQTSYYLSSSDSNYKNATLNSIMHKSPASNGDDSVDITGYWLASRSIDCGSSFCQFRVRYVSSRNVESVIMKNSNGYSTSYSFAVRPVINLNSRIQAEYSAKYNDTYNLWNLK